MVVIVLKKRNNKNNSPRYIKVYIKLMLILETLSTNRDLKEKIKEAEEMLRDIKYEDLPSYEIGYNNAIIKELNIKKEELLEYMKNKNNS